MLKGGKDFPELAGIVTFKEVSNGVLVTAKINGLPQSDTSCFRSLFGFHIHEGTSCTGNVTDEFANAKSHLNSTIALILFILEIYLL